VKNVPRNNGKVGQWGISYPGFYTAMGMIDAHPALLASSPQAPVCDWFVGDDFHHNGAFYLAHAYGFFSTSGRPQKTPMLPVARPEPIFKDAYRFFLEVGTLADLNEKVMKREVPFWNDMMAHGTYDAFWKARNMRPHLKKIRPAVLTVGGWFDAENLFGALHVYGSVERQSPETTNVLAMGPWWHGGWAGSDGASLGAVNFGFKTSVGYRDDVEARFFRRVLKEGSRPDLAEATMFETGRNEWRRLDRWPPEGLVSRSLHLREGGRLSFAASEDAEGFDEYVSDPAKPVPFTAGTAGGMTREHMVDDQRFAATRPDVLVYQTEPLEQDLTVAGPITPSLIVSTTGTDADWVVKLIDVYPDSFPDPQPNPAGVRMAGYQQLVRGECMRGKFRISYETPEPFEPGKPAVVEYVMPDVLHTFRKGHRIMVQIQSSWFPLVDRNPQVFTDIYSARLSDFRKATQRVHRSKSAPSLVRIGVLP
jgi:putative CocE/NonD family hydrolase